MKNFSQIGFILATLGSSIGLGHIWRFPYMAGQNGGGAFVLLFLVLLLVIGVSLLLADMIIGNRGKKDVVSCFEMLDPTPTKKWKYAGIAIIGGPLILSFYAVILGWILYYLVVVSFDLPKDLRTSKQTFEYLMGAGIYWQIIGFSGCLFLSALIVSFGIKKGIELLNLVLMPLLFIIFIGLLVYTLFQPSFLKAWHFLFDFKYEAIDANVLISALSQVFFSLSLGVGTIITYAAATSNSQNLFKSALWIVLTGLLISIIAGLMIFTFFFGYDGDLGEDSTQSIGLVFISLPLIFSEFGSTGQILSVAFLLALLFAGITSTISMLEPMVSFLVNRHNFSRISATWGVSFIVFIIGMFALYSMTKDYKALLSFGGKNIFVWLNFLTASFIMPLSSLCCILFLGFVIKKDTLRSYTTSFLNHTLFEIWYFIIRFVAPIVIVSILIFKLLEPQ
ncbi:sodium-dependent transporter [Helicobacter fennelliae]|uniref:Transporter n=2 Tax=Helicobacter fennelliae TaxID=215 RepID=T1D3Z9_9HELI|nr:sodium-dependent transporter [Helicobacter fennelliae]GAD19916.1 hypothetical protein HFN_1156 [Helicobacter fennelliae MRY12-0050]SQB98750.1 sodium and chloride dependent transporter protein [Helicobacter fennelliae]STP08092.1 sodium and chloride dependent transporter protein [Helicobacter fennelliae]STQ84000.1 sodium and chloride dependent transporter protein [Helicobacter fennelliae]